MRLNPWLSPLEILRTAADRIGITRVTVGPVAFGDILREAGCAALYIDEDGMNGIRVQMRAGVFCDVFPSGQISNASARDILEAASKEGVTRKHMTAFLDGSSR